MKKLVVAKFGGSTLGEAGGQLPRVIERIKELAREARVVAVFSAPMVKWNGAKRSFTDVALEIGRAHAESVQPEPTVFEEVYRGLAADHLTVALRAEFEGFLERANREVSVALRQARENRRFADVTRARMLAYSGELTMATLMHYVLRSSGVNSARVEFEHWPIRTDNFYDGANFLVPESKAACARLYELVDGSDVVSMGGFIGRTVDGLETTYERGGSDRTAADLAILLAEKYEVSVNFEKDSAVMSADPRMERRSLERIQHLSYNEAKNAAMFGMKILDPLAIREIESAGLDIPLRITNLAKPEEVTTITAKGSPSANPIQLVVGRRGCAIVRMEERAASHLAASLLKERRYSEFLLLSPFNRGEVPMARLLFLDSDFVRRHERLIRAFDATADLVFDRGVVTAIGDEMWRAPLLVSIASGAIGEAQIQILNMDVQEETSRVLIVVQDSDGNVERAIRAIHAQRELVRKLTGPASSSAPSLADGSGSA